MSKQNGIKILFIIVLFTFVSSCNISKNATNVVTIPSFYYKSYTGFVITNTNGVVFYKIEEKYLQNYLNSNTNDTLIISNILKKTRSIYLLKGRSIEYFAWRKYFYRLEKECRLINLNVDNCYGGIKSSLIPVILVSCNYRTNTLTKISECNKYLDKTLVARPELNVVYIMPLDLKLASEFQDMRDSITLQSPEYQKWLYPWLKYENVSNSE